MLRIGLIGAGTIGKTLSEAFKNKEIHNAKLEIIGDKSISNARELATEHKCKASANIIDDFSKMPLDLVVEAASQTAVHEYANKILEKGIDLVIMSAGALIDTEFYNNLRETANKNNCKIYLPSGAIGGVDLIKSASNSRLDSVNIITRKSPKSLGYNKPHLKHEEIVFQGNVREAVKIFPANVNVAAVLALAGLGPDKTGVTVICDPTIEYNIHEITITGTFGSCTINVSNAPSPQNKKTSHLASLSLISAINNLSETIVIS